MHVSKTYSVKEIREILAREALDKAKANADIDDRIGKLMDMCLKVFGEKTPLGDPSASPSGKAKAPVTKVM